MGTMETIGINPGDRAEAPEFFLWEAPGKPIAIYLHYQVIDRLLQEVMRGFGLVPKRGAEVGGLLLGSVEHGERLIVRIQDFEPVPCEHSRGPSYLLSEADLKKFESAIDRRQAEGQAVVGYYRSHTRDGLSLCEEDLDLLGTYFPRPSDVTLLVKPFATRVSVAGFFFRENGEYQAEASYREFPFRRRELGGGVAPERAPREEAPVQPEDSGFEAEMRDAILRDSAAAPAAIPREDAGSSASSLKPRWVWIPLSFIFLLLGTLLGFQASLALRSAKDAQPRAMHSYSLALSATRSGNSLHIQWDRQAPAVRESSKGLLLIIDGDFKKQVDLEAAQLQNGSVIYRNVSQAVTLRLEVYPGGRNTVIESLEVR